MMVKLKDGRRTCSCKIGASHQSLGPDFEAEILHLLDPLGYPEGTIDYVRGLENHPHRGTDPDIQRALHLIRRTNTRRPPDRLSTTDESDGYADDESFHGFGTSSLSSPITEDEQIEKDERELAKILRVIRGKSPAERPQGRRSSTRDDHLEPGTPTTSQATVPTHARRTTTPPAPGTSSSEEDTPLRIKLRSSRVLMKAPRKKLRKKKAPR